MNEEPLGLRLRTIRKQLNLTLEEFGEPLDVSKAAVSRWENGGQVTKTVCLAIEAAHKISSIWLMRGEGSQFVQQVGRGTRIEERPGLEFALIEGAPTCGPGGEVEDSLENAERFSIDRPLISQILWQCGAGDVDTLFFARCKGDSMRPTIHDGDLALINTAEQLRLNPSPEGIYMVRREPHSNDAMIKRANLSNGGLVFRSDGQGYRDIQVEVDGVRIQELVLGRVCWISRDILADEGPGRW